MARLDLHVGPLRVRWHARHTRIEMGSMFEDDQVKGPFRRWRHVHRMIESGDGCELRDEIEYELPVSSISEPLAGSAVRRRIDRLFAYRHRITRHDLRLHRRYGAAPLRVAVSGSTGLIGSQLVHLLESGGHHVVRVVRDRERASAKEACWDYRENEIELEKLEGLDAFVHLAGENVLVPRWSEQKKMEILGSRVRGTEHLARNLADLDAPPTTFISASGIGYYGNRSDQRLDEDSFPGDDGFLSAVCQDWERAALPAAEAGIRTVQLRIGIVLTPAGGVLAPLLLPFKMGLGGRYGGRRQYLSWIGLDDAVGAIYHLIANDAVTGAVNLTAPEPVTLDEFSRTLGRVLSRPTAVNLPPALIRAVLGEVADEAALMSVRAVPQRLRSSGFTFEFPHVEDLLRHILGRSLEPTGVAGGDTSRPSHNDVRQTT